MSELSKWLRCEIDQIRKAEQLGLPRSITRADAMIAYQRAAEDIELLEKQISELQPVRQGP